MRPHTADPISEFSARLAHPHASCRAQPHPPGIGLDLAAGARLECRHG